MMWVRLLKSEGRHKIGKVLKVVNGLGLEWIKQKKAIKYTEGFPVKKMRTDLFKPKK